MSTVVVVQKGNKAVIAGESLTSFGSTKLNGNYKLDDNKVFPWKQSYIGMVGNVAMKMIMLDIIKNRPEPDLSNRAAIFKYITELHKDLKEDYFINPSDEEDDPVESSQYEMAIANQYGIFGIHSLREVYQFSRFWAWGSGTDYALGAMHALYDLEGVDARQIAIAGVKAGIEFDDGSAGEIVLYEVELAQ
jgi:ATP-dependent HslUV protease subunit HslV